MKFSVEVYYVVVKNGKKAAAAERLVWIQKRKVSMPQAGWTYLNNFIEFLSENSTPPTPPPPAQYFMDKLNTRVFNF